MPCCSLCCWVRSCLVIYPSLPPIGVVEAVSLVITPPNASGSKAQMVTLRGGIRATSLVARHTWRSFGPSFLPVRGFCSGLACLLLELAEVTSYSYLLWHHLPFCVYKLRVQQWEVWLLLSSLLVLTHAINLLIFSSDATFFHAGCLCWGILCFWPTSLYFPPQPMALQGPPNHLPMSF